MSEVGAGTSRCPPTLPGGDARAAHGTPGHPLRSLRSRVLPEPDRRQGAPARRGRSACRHRSEAVSRAAPLRCCAAPWASRPISCSSGSPATPMLRLRRRWGGCGARRCCSTRSCRSRRPPKTAARLDGWLGSRRLELEDRLACRWADRVLVDTDAHGDHFATELATPRSKLRRLWVGADDDVMRPRPEAAHDDFRVFVYASFIPLHGLEHVVRAAAILEKRGEKVSIDLVGSGDTESSVRALTEQLGVHSITFVGRRPYEELPERMARSDLCLGIFGTSPKARRVIPNKVFDALGLRARRHHRRHPRGPRAVAPRRRRVGVPTRRPRGARRFDSHVATRQRPTPFDRRGRPRPLP